jgi:hypothetical protein
MSFSAKKPKPKFYISAVIHRAALILFLSLTALITAIVFAYKDTSPIVIESLESKTINDAPVFNSISFLPARKQDTWLMKQSHNGAQWPAHQWDSLAIVVDKTHSPKTAQYFQFKANRKTQIDFKVSCFLCHSNGPRAIRPNLNSTDVPNSTWALFRIQILNLRIKTYGRVVHTPTEFEKLNAKTPFRWASSQANEKLNVKTCLTCHNENGFLARGLLTRQNFLAINFLLKNKLMPPSGFKLSDEELAQINKFTQR